MTYKMKTPRPARRGKLLAPRQVADLQLVVRVFCETNDAHDRGGSEETRITIKNLSRDSLEVTDSSMISRRYTHVAV